MRREAELRPVRPADIDALAARLRAQDIAELAALGATPGEERGRIAESVSLSFPDLCHSVWSPTGELMGICGLAPVQHSMLGVVSASPWMLGTDAVPRFGRELNRTTRRYNRAMLGRCPFLFNHVHAANTVSVAWLRRVGFRLEPATPFGPRGELFHLFTMRNV
jgi:hypothetical protein